MHIKKILKKSSFLVAANRKSLRLAKNANLLGLMPINFGRILKIPKYMGDRQTFKKLGGTITHFYPITDDYSDSAGVASGHYFHQDLIVAQFIFESNPKRHIDVGSRIDGFVAHVATFREIEIFDIRNLPTSDHSNIVFRQADLMLGADSEITDSLSCLHTLEHFGLGRYGDSLDPEGYLKGFKNLVSMLKPGGILYISFPIGISNETHFNAHRVFHPKEILNWAPEVLKLTRFDYVDDSGNLHKEFDLLSSDLQVTHGCGIYSLKKANKVP